MAEKRLSSFATIVITGGLLYIIFLLYYIGSEIITVQSANTIIIQKQKEVAALVKKRNEKLQTKYIMLSPQYQDRTAKESKNYLANGEKEFLLPAPTVAEKEDTKKVPSWEQTKTIPEQWHDVFFPPQAS